MNRIVEITRHTANTAEVMIESPSIAASARAGHFVMIRFSDDLPRIPFTIVDTNPERGFFTIIIHKGARLTSLIDSLEPGQALPNLLGPLGQAFDVKNYGTVLCIGDGEGFVPLLPVIHALKNAGNKVISVLSEFTEKTSCLRGNAEKWSDEILHSSSKEEALEVLDRVTSEREIDLVVITGPTDMLRSIAERTRSLNIPTRCILNMIMLDGVGICGICRVMVGGERKLTCIDGPTFDAHEVDFTQLLNRQRNFI
ncbi:MAG: sulfide/dihydroorotate dehydrogenase-like FAD/NAD-binding protein [Muribaculaceae bacterium]|nr:sulfide/dihydroorotate dehydrogenase-like FAD/NAD-binding protein [Muribaculaceae bacterium]